MKTLDKPTYISLFSSAGIGCYGFKLEGFDCVATNELIARRLEIQRFNHKCKYDSGYLCGDITEDAIKDALYAQIALWKKKEGLSRVDVVVATPPCQGMSVANQKKSGTEIVRNSLVIESIKIIKEIDPRFFVFENVPAFMKTICTDIDGEEKTIAAAIESNLGQAYSYASRVINFKNFGACSSRQRTVVIGVSKDFADEVSPLELYPNLVQERTLREVIGGLKPLKEFGEIDQNDIYHSFRPYPEHMRAWIADIKEGQSAFDNAEDNKKPHRVVDGKIVINQRKNADKYTRQYWDKVGPCIHTRNDQLASQNTVHPCDDRVFSIRELMLMMTVPASFKWVETEFDFLNHLPAEQKRALLKKEEIKIRQSLGEAVPTVIFQSIASKMAAALQYPALPMAAIHKLVSSHKLTNVKKLKEFIVKNPMHLSAASLGKIAELANTRRTDNAAFFTSKSLITEMIKALPDTDQDTVRILEPSVGVGNFLPLIIKKFEGKNITIDVFDIDAHSLEFAELILKNYSIPETCTVNYIHDDFLLHDFIQKYDYVIGNPPFFKMKSTDQLLQAYRRNAVNKITNNICSFFLDKAVKIGDYVALVLPKFLLNTPEFALTRDYLSKKAIDCIIDFGERGFPGVLVETIAIFINNMNRPNKTRVVSVTHGKYLSQPQNYIFDKKLPYWIIYRDLQFDSVCKKLDFDVFDVFRDRQITNTLLSSSGEIRVLKSRNISDDGKKIIDLTEYDAYIDYDVLKELTVFEYLDRDDVYLTPNMTYNPRMMKKPKNCVVNGSVAILIPKNHTVPTEKQMEFFSTQEYRAFYKIARNHQTRSLNVDACSVFFYGLLREIDKKSPIIEAFSEQDNTEHDVQPMKWGKNMLSQQDIIDFCNQHNYDIRVSHNGRWIDQKCTPDVIWSISDFVLDYVDRVNERFTVKDIWQSEYARQTIAETYSKPGTDEATAEKEYDKVFAQPLSMLCYAGILKDISRTSRHLYVVENRAVLEYIARNDVCALRFLQCYIEKVLTDSGLMGVFNEFFEKQDTARFNAMKQAFIDFYHNYTPVQKEYEPKRIFTKVVNPLAFGRDKLGSEKGRMSKHRINRSDMMYNQDNFRDVYRDKPKEVTRQEWLATHPDIDRRDGYFEQMMSRAKKLLREFISQYRENISELTMFIPGQDDDAAPTQTHHIFPKNEFPEIMHFAENMIKLTPNQHYGFAHPNNNTQTIGLAAQKDLLLAKAYSIRQNLTSGVEEPVFEFHRFLQVLSVGWEDESVLEIAENNFIDVIQAIHDHYAAVREDEL